MFVLESTGNSVLSEWNLSNIDLETSRSTGTRVVPIGNSDHMARASLEHELRVSSRGEETEYIRTSAESEEVARKYMIMRALQISQTEKSRNARNLDPFQERCINLTQQFREANSDCLSQPCDLSSPFRSIDGCCNNVANPTQGIIVIRLILLLGNTFKA